MTIIIKFCNLRSVVLAQFRKSVGPCAGQRDKTISDRQKLLLSFQNEHCLYLLTNI